MTAMNACKLADIDFYGEHAPIEIVNPIMKLYDYYVAKDSKFIADSLIFIGWIVFTQ